MSVWTPDDAATPPVLWVCARDSAGRSGADNAVMLLDRSGHDHHLTQSGSVGAWLAAGAINGRDALSFTGAPVLVGPSLDLTGSVTIIVVASQHALPYESVYRVLFETGALGGGVVVRAYPRSDRQRLELGDGATLAEGANGSWPNPPRRASVYVIRRVVGDYTRLEVDGLALELTGPSALANPGTVRLGGGVGSASYRNWLGYIGEFIIIPDALSDAELDQYVGYAAHAWGLEGRLPGTHAYRYAPPGTAVLAGNATVSGGGAVDQVRIQSHTWPHETVAVVTPDVTGNWGVSVPPGDYDIVYVAAGCQPIMHGPYTVTPA